MKAFSSRLSPGSSRARRALALSVLVLSCSRKDVGAASSEAPSVSAVALAPSLATAAAAAPLSGLDPCLVGKWQASGATLQLDQVKAQGGANVLLEIAPSGASVIDFGPMSDVHATSSGFSFDFRYSGKATATLKSATRGSLDSENENYAALRVTATAKLPGAGAIPLFKDTPVAELAKMGSALVGAGKGLPKAPTSAAAPSAVKPGTPANGIDSNPVFASTRYTCEGDALSLQGGERGFTWLFVRAPH
jgi:hypothetical protein